jgi:hypothetical protein
MKPRRVNLTREFGDAPQPLHPENRPTNKVNLFDDPEDKTPVAPAPTLAMLVHAGAPWYLRHRYPLAAVVGAVLILAAFAMGRTSSRVAPVDPVTQPVAVLPSVVPPAPLAAPAVETIMLSVAVSPANAHVLIDGQLMPSNPFLARYPRSTTTHRLRVVAPGYEPKERWVAFSDNVVLDISLTAIQVAESPWVRNREREHVRGRPSAARRQAALPAAPVLVSPSPFEIVPRPDEEKSPRRRIEVTDPYAKDQ